MAKKKSLEATVRSVIMVALARNDMKQKDLAPLLKKSEGQISRMINGETKMVLFDLVSLDRILGFTNEEWLSLRGR